jgi:hypothetical protein
MVYVPVEEVDFFAALRRPRDTAVISVFLLAFPMKHITVDEILILGTLLLLLARDEQKDVPATLGSEHPFRNRLMAFVPPHPR